MKTVQEKWAEQREELANIREQVEEAQQSKFANMRERVEEEQQSELALLGRR